MATISINLNVPQGWHKLDDDQLRYVYSLIANECVGVEFGCLRNAGTYCKRCSHSKVCKVIIVGNELTWNKRNRQAFSKSGKCLAIMIIIRRVRVA